MADVEVELSANPWVSSYVDYNRAITYIRIRELTFNKNAMTNVATLCYVSINTGEISEPRRFGAYQHVNNVGRKTGRNVIAADYLGLMTRTGMQSRANTNPLPYLANYGSVITDMLLEYRADELKLFIRECHQEYRETQSYGMYSPRSAE